MPTSESEQSHRVILIPIDGSDHSDRAYQFYTANLKADNDLIIFINVIEAVFSTPSFALSVEQPLVPDLANIIHVGREKGREVCTKALTKAKQDDVAAKALLHINSSPGEAIVKAIDEYAVQMVIIGNRGLGAIRRTLLGSVSDYVLHHSHVPVTVIPPPKADHHHHWIGPKAKGYMPL